jgi:hypothetical protein
VNRAQYGFKAVKPGRASVRTRDRARAVGIIVGRNAEGEQTVTLYINHGKESVKAKLLLWEFYDAINTAIRTAP